MSPAHLDGRLALLRLDLADLGDSYPHISGKIALEIEMIEDEIALRAAGKSKPSPVIPEFEPEFEGWDLDSLAFQAETLVRENESCEN